MATDNSISEKPANPLRGGFIFKLISTVKTVFPCLLTVRQRGMRELASGSCKPLQAIKAEKFPGAAFTRVRLAAGIECGSITWAIIYIDIAREGLAGWQDTTGANPAVVCSSGPVRSQRTTIANAACRCTTGRVDEQFGSEADRQGPQAHDGVVDVGCGF